MTKNNIKKLRYSRNLSQRQLAEILELKQTLVSRWELGKAEPTVDQAISLASFFGVSPAYVLGQTTERDDCAELLSPDMQMKMIAEDYREREILEVYRSLNGYGKDYFMQTVKMIEKWYFD